MAFKFGRNYSLSIGTQDPAVSVLVALPFTMEFDINRTYFSSANTASIRVYNLSERNRNLVRKDVYTTDIYRSIELKAGYGTNLPVILKGNITQAWSVREGTDFITEVNAFDAGFAFVNGITNSEFPEGTDQKTIINTLIKSLKNFNVSTGAIGDYTGATKRGTAYSGNTTEVLKEITGGGFFIDNGIAHCLRDDEVLSDLALVINSQSGLLGTPILEETLVRLTILFEPAVKVGQLVKVESLTEKRFNGFYKVTGVHHKGLISQSVAGSATTELSLVNGSFNPVAAV